MVSRNGTETALELTIAMQAALFNFQSLLVVVLLLICTCAYAHSIFPGIMDRNKDGYDLL